MTEATYHYSQAFSRNLGWVADHEQETLRQKTVAIAGMGGVGGVHLLTLSRLGIGGFHIADFDRFDLANFNRQVGATVSTIGQPKAEVLQRMALDINPELRLKRFDDGVTPVNIDAFLDGVNLYVDGLDFFAFSARQLVFAACARRGIPAVTVAPVGMGAALLVFVPGGMSFEDYFQWQGQDEHEMALRFLVGLTPASLHRGYLVDLSRVSLQERRTPSTVMGCQLAAGIAATETLKLLLGRGTVRAAPWATQFDAYRNKVARTWRPGGNRNPIQRLMLVLARRQLDQLMRAAARR
jgi:molybdopterin/thiamine biosynthesis adenylyltransferase